MKPRLLIKIGGRAFENEIGFRDLAGAIKSDPGLEVVIVHGGGAEISQALKQARRKTVFVDGIRVTGSADIKIVEQVLSGTINARIAGWLRNNGIACRRMSGKSDRLFIVEPLTRKGQDFGYVGKIIQVNPEGVLRALNSGQVPVISPIAANNAGESYNVNADSAAAALAAKARCSDLIFITDVPGVLKDDLICPSLNMREVSDLIANGTIKGGMVAKMEAAMKALNGKVPRVHIIQWQGPQTLHRIIDQKDLPGTTIHP